MIDSERIHIYIIMLDNFRGTSDGVATSASLIAPPKTPILFSSYQVVPVR